MIIEAMKLALEAIQDLRGYRPDIDKAIETLRTAIQQAEAQQPDTGEPVAVTSWKELERLQAGIGSIASIFPVDTAGFHVQLYTRPAPSVPDDDFDLICNAIDKADSITMEGDYMLDSDDCIAVVRVMQVLLSVRAAMLAT